MIDFLLLFIMTPLVKTGQENFRKSSPLYSYIEDKSFPEILNYEIVYRMNI